MRKVPMTNEEALARLRRYCASQDRSHSEVRSKLLSLGIYGDDLEEIISILIRDDFLNEERYARSFARGKFQLKKWGRLKIRQHLRQQKISDYCIDKAMEEIDEELYMETLTIMMTKKMDQLSHLETFERLRKVSSYCISKGYEQEIVFPLAKSLLPENQ